MRTYYEDYYVTTLPFVTTDDATGEVIPAGSLVYVFIRNGYYCNRMSAVAESTIDDYFFTCEDCHAFVPQDDAYIYTIDDSGIEREVCEDCLMDHSEICDCCGVRFSNEFMQYVEYDERSVCNSCYDDTYTTCDRCGETVRYNDAYSYGDEYLCEDCHDETDNLLNYSYKPTPIFYDDSGASFAEPTAENLFMGVELEVEANSHYDLCEITHNLPREVYCKEDGSLGPNGVEIVSHPCTLNRLFTVYDEVIETCKGRARSHDTGTCGLHVHLDRSFFGERPEPQETNLGKFVALFKKFDDALFRFSRRSRYNLDRWAKTNDCAIYGGDKNIAKSFKNADDTAKSNGERYVAVNLCNHYTVEVRIFNGTLRRESFFAALELCSVLANYAINHTDKEIEAATWGEVIGSEPTKYLEDYCEYRGINPDDKGRRAFSSKPSSYREEVPKLRVGDLVMVRDESFYSRVLVGNVDPWTDTLNEHCMIQVERPGDVWNNFNTVTLVNPSTQVDRYVTTNPRFTASL